LKYQRAVLARPLTFLLEETAADIVHLVRQNTESHSWKFLLLDRPPEDSRIKIDGSIEIEHRYIYPNDTIGHRFPPAGCLAARFLVDVVRSALVPAIRATAIAAREYLPKRHDWPYE
jgi:hypothetical protein